MTEVIESMLQNRHFIVELGSKKSRWRRLNNGPPQGSVLAPLLFNINTNDQPRNDVTRHFIYADDLGVAAQHESFIVVAERLTTALDDLTPYSNITNWRRRPQHLKVAVHQRCGIDSTRVCQESSTKLYSTS